MSDAEVSLVQDLIRRIEAIEARNRKVEIDKGWETSTTRKVSVLLATYFAMCLLFASLGNEAPLLHAVVPTLGFFLSTLSLPIVRERWKRWNVGDRGDGGSNSSNDSR